MSIELKTLEDLLRRAAVAIKPSESNRVSETAEKYRKINNPGSYVGDWDNGFAPYLVEIMDTTSSVEFDAVIFAGPARCGKSDIFFNYLLHTQKNDPSDMLLVHMTKTTARDWSMGDLRKAFRASPELGDMVMPGRQNMNVHDIHFIGDTRLLVKWPTIAELSGKTIPRHWLMDYDRMPPDIENEGPAFHLTKKRGDTFSVSYRMTVAESSPGFEIEPAEDGHEWEPEGAHEAPPTKGILSLYNEGDRRRWYWRCACCKTPFEGDFEHLVWDKTIADPFRASQTVRLKCTNEDCGFEHTHEANIESGQPGKVGLNRSGVWVREGQYLDSDGLIHGNARQSTTASFWLKGVAAAFASWQSLVFKYLKAMNTLRRTGSDGDLKTTINVDQGHPYSANLQKDKIAPETLMRRKRHFSMGEVPDGVRFLVATIDVQVDRFDVMVTGFDTEGTAYIIDRRAIRHSMREDEEYPGQMLPIDPAKYPEDWDVLMDEVIEKKYPLADGSDRAMGIKLSATDSGGKDGFTVNAYSFWRRLKADNRGHHERFLLLKGASREDAPQFKITYPNTERKDRKAKARGEIPVGMIGTLIQKDKAYQMICKEDGPGRISFAEGLPKTLFKELLAETRLPTKWDNPKRLRNESFDLLVYAISILKHRTIKYDQIKWENPPDWAEEWHSNCLIFEMNEDTGVWEEPTTPEEVQPKKRLASLGAALA